MKIGIFFDLFSPITNEHIKTINKIHNNKRKFDNFFLLPEYCNKHILNMIELVLPKNSNIWKFNFKENKNSLNQIKKIAKQFPNSNITIFIDYSNYSNHKWFKKNMDKYNIVFLNQNLKISPLNSKQFIISNFDVLDKKVHKYISNNFLYANEIIKEKLSQERYIHSCNVANLAYSLAKIHNVSPIKAWIAGMFHDITKELENDEQEFILKKYKIQYDWPNPVKHQMTGALWFKHVYKSNDKQIFSAISKHTTASKDMTLFDKVVYMADVLSKDRRFKNIKKERKILYTNFNEAFLRALSRMESFTIQKHKIMDKRAKDIVKHHLK